MLGVIGGSGLYDLSGMEVVKEIEIKTPFGEPSSPVVIGKLGGKEVAFLARHGRDHSYPPHLVPYRANLWALKEVGVRRVIGVSAVGSIKEGIKPGDFVLIDNFLDFTKGREATYYEGRFSKTGEGKVVHIDVTEPYCPEMRSVLSDILREMGVRFHREGVYACTEGPRFETRAEIRALRALGADVVGMTGYPEVVLARELAMCYASLCVVANLAAGLSDRKLTSDEVMELMARKEEQIKEIIARLVQSLHVDRRCGCAEILEGADTRI
ncbi:MAG TPA: S-methyl-5'-thioadenosine phosphorylase [Aquifex aeolicus]|nr:S-methyl-5'-thioadenosine phosphorylase [Aquifex aeolicus]